MSGVWIITVGREYKGPGAGGRVSPHSDKREDMDWKPLAVKTWKK